MTFLRRLGGTPALVLASALGFGAALAVHRPPAPPVTSEAQRQLHAVVALLRTQYVDTLGEHALYGAASRALVGSLHDPFTELMTQADYAQFSAQVAGKAVGAAPGGLRAASPVPSVDASLLGDGRTGYLALRTVTERTGAEVRGAVTALQLRGMRRLVLDLRGNPGGLVAEAVAVSDLFLDPGLAITTLRGRATRFSRTYRSVEPQAWPDLPVVVLVDPTTASSAELIAAALQEHRRARVVGTRTFGKGVIQTTFPLDEGGALKLTTARWYTPSGRNVTRATIATGASWAPHDPAADDGGIVPDVAVSATRRPAADRALARALGPDQLRFRHTIDAFAAELAVLDTGVTEHWRPDTAVLDELHARLVADGIGLTREAYRAGRPQIARQLAYAVVRRALGADAELARRSRDDEQLAVALRLLARAP